MTIIIHHVIIYDGGNMIKLLEKIIKDRSRQGYIWNTKAIKKDRDKAITNIANDLNVARGTVTRWIELDSVPNQYRFDLMKLAGLNIDYSKFTAKDKDQFFTPTDTAKYCYDKFCEIISDLGESEKDYSYIEPSAGDGSFLAVLPDNRTVSLDIEPRHESVIQQDFLSWRPPLNKNNVVFGNPPFGLRGHMALKFINHSKSFADYVVFILPQLFESDGKGSPRKRIKGLNLIHSEKLQTKFYDPDGKQMKINVVFQVWSKNHANPEFDLRQHRNGNIAVYSLSNGRTPSQQRNTKMIGKCDIYLPSTCFGKNNMRVYSKFEDLPGQKGYGIVFKGSRKELIKFSNSLDWSDIAFLSTNSALNLRTSNIYNALKEFKMKFKTVSFKGSKRKLLPHIEKRINEVNATDVFDGFSGAGIVSGYLRSQGYKVFSNDKMPSCNLFSSVFLNGFNKDAVKKHIDHINWLAGISGWVTNNYSGEKKRKIKGVNRIESRPLGFTKSNAMKIDVARDYAELIADENDRNAVIFSIILAMDKAFNNTNDQKSCLKSWTASALADIVFHMPTLVEGPKGEVCSGDILDIKRKNYDVVYLDPPYTSGVLYDTCYHLNDSIALWDQPALDSDYAVPRPERAAYRKKNKSAGAYYSKPRAVEDFTKLLKSFDCKRIILSYSDAPRNILTFEELATICKSQGTLTIDAINHKICSQPNSLKKISTKLTEFLFIIDK